ncbi:MAG: CopD family protein [Cytophagales bacterium]
MNLYLVVKSLHIIFVVTWFAGLFYIYRLFIYHAEVQDKSAEEASILSSQFKIMQKRLWLGITWPSALLVMSMGTWLLCINPWFLTQTFFQIKLFFLLLLYSYHFYTHYLYLKFQNNEIIIKPNTLRILNEVATVFLVAIVFLIELQNAISFVYALLGLFLFVILLMTAIKVYKKIREN